MSLDSDARKSHSHRTQTRTTNGDTYLRRNMMLNAHRFTAVPTQDCRDRLDAALANERPIARGEKNRAAVVAIQYALADLSRGYLLAAEVDGFFGPRTQAAVEAFQRDYGLVADGMVGRQTITQLDE